MDGKGSDREGTRSHFQVGFRTARPLEGTSNDSDIAAREFKSLTPSGSLSASTYTYRLSPVFYVCARIHIYPSIYLSFDLVVDELDLREKNIPNLHRIFFFLPSSDKIFPPRPLDILSIRESNRNGCPRVHPPFPFDGKFRFLQTGFIIVIFLSRSLETGDSN